jgi:hypothetical protein
LFVPHENRLGIIIRQIAAAAAAANAAVDVVFVDE